MKGRKLLMIPGPIEFTPEVLRTMGEPTTSHVAPNFIEMFGTSLERLRHVFFSPSGQPFIVAGSGTLAMDMAAANLVEPGDRALVVNTGYFSDRFATILERYGASVTQVKAREPGDVPSLSEIENALRRETCKLVTVTHVDTSTAVRADLKRIAALSTGAGALVVADGVCSVAGEELRMEEWNVDLTLTASQKALGTPPGLAVLMAGPRAMETFRKRKTPVQNYYADWNEWLPIMEAYEARKPSYFATPAVNLIAAFSVSLEQILAEGMEARFERHARLSRAFKAALTALGLTQVPLRPEIAASTLSAVYYPSGIDASLLNTIGERGVIVAGGLLPSIKTKYFRVGHMGAVTPADILATVGALEHALRRAGYSMEPGKGLAAAEAVLVA